MQVYAPSFRLEGPPLSRHPPPPPHLPSYQKNSLLSMPKWKFSFLVDTGPDITSLLRMATILQANIISKLPGELLKTNICILYFSSEGICVSHETEKTTSLPWIPKILGRSYIKMTEQKNAKCTWIFNVQQKLLKKLFRWRWKKSDYTIILPML